MKHLTITATLAMLLTLSACGGSTYREQEETAPSAPSTQNLVPLPNGGGGITTDFDPSYSFNFELTGTSGSSPIATTEVETDSILKIRVNSGAASNLSVPGYSNWSAPYGCVQFTIQINGETGHSITTQILRVEGGPSQYICPNAPTSQVIDFSPYVGGLGATEIRVKAAKYDFRCLWVNSMECPISPVYSSHTVTGTLDIQVNGTFIPN